MSPLPAVLQIGAFPFPLGQGSQVYVGGMCRALARAGAPVWLASYGGGVGAWPEGVRRVPVPALPAITTRRSGPHAGKLVLDTVLVAAVARLLARERVDVIHAHNVEAPLVGALARLASHTRVPLVYNLHTSLEEELPAYWRGGVGARVAPAVGRLVDHALPRLADACVALSPRAEAHLAAHGARRVVCIPPGVDVDEIRHGDAARARATWDLDSRPWVLYSGNTDAYQDLDLLLDAMRAVGGAGLLIVTSSPASEVWARVDAAGLPRGRVRVVGDAGLGALRDALAVATVGAVPRRVCTGFPIKLLNLLGAGVVTVAADGSAQEIPGCVAVVGTPTAFAAALNACLSDSAGRLASSRDARAAVERGWSWSARAAELLQFYATLR